MKDSSFSWEWHQPDKDLSTAFMVRAVFVQTTRKNEDTEGEQIPHRIQLQPGSEEFLVWILRVYSLS